MTSIQKRTAGTLASSRPLVHRAEAPFYRTLAVTGTFLALTKFESTGPGDCPMIKLEPGNVLLKPSQRKQLMTWLRRSLRLGERLGNFVLTITMQRSGRFYEMLHPPERQRQCVPLRLSLPPPRLANRPQRADPVPHPPNPRPSVSSARVGLIACSPDRLILIGRRARLRPRASRPLLAAAAQSEPRGRTRIDCGCIA